MHHRIKNTFQYAVGKSLEVETAYNAFSKASELKCLRIVNKAVFGQLLPSTMPDVKRRWLQISGCF